MIHGIRSPFTGPLGRPEQVGTHRGGASAASLLAYHASASTSAALQVRTDEGDTISIQATRSSEVTYASVRSRSGDADGARESRARFTEIEIERGLSIQVEGSLNDEEKADLQELVSRVFKAVRQFAKGNVEAGAALATEGGRDLESLDGFSLQFSHSESLTVASLEARQSEPLPPAAPPATEPKPAVAPRKPPVSTLPVQRPVGEPAPTATPRKPVVDALPVGAPVEEPATRPAPEPVESAAPQAPDLQALIAELQKAVRSTKAPADQVVKALRAVFEKLESGSASVVTRSQFMHLEESLGAATTAVF